MIKNERTDFIIKESCRDDKNVGNYIINMN